MSDALDLLVDVELPDPSERPGRIGGASDRDVATVTVTSPLRVRREVGGSDERVARTVGWTPTFDGRVLLLRFGSEWVAIGEVQP